MSHGQQSDARGDNSAVHGILNIDGNSGGALIQDGEMGFLKEKTKEQQTIHKEKILSSKHSNNCIGK